MMKLSRFGRSAAALGAILALGLAASVSRAQLATFCAEVKLEILQEATLEREAFDASLKVNNNLPDKPLTNLRVNIFVKDELGNPADSAFFIKIATLTNTNAIDGTGVVQSSTTAEIRWLIIPSTGAGGILTGGKRYSVRATINGISADAPQSVTTFDDFITVYPQPSLKLEYVLPYEVFGDEPLTAGIEPIEPFPLGVRVTNIGYGLAKNFKIESAQPKIVENKQGLLVDFKLLGTVVGGVTIPDTLLVPFGNIAPQGVGQASWIMSTSLSGRFIEFTSTFTHAAELGGQLTSLIESVTTYTLLRDVLVDLPGRDATPDFLVNASMDRAQMQALLDAGGQPPAELLLESDQQTPLAVLEAPAALSGSLGGTSASLTLAFTQGVGPNLWVHASAPITRSAGLVLQSARASDGRALNAKNVWISKHFRKSDLSVAYRINILDLTSGASSYTINFDPASLDAAPGRVIDLAAVTAPGGGALNLSWSAPGDDGYTGRILGGRYLIEHEIVASAPFTPTLAQVNSATSTAPGNSQFYTLGGLVGNASTYLRLWTQDTGGAISEVSNGATAYTLPNPPRDLLLTAISSVGAHAAWQAGNNSSPIAYRVYAATAADGVAVSSSPYKDSFVREFDFANLAPSTTYTVFGEARNPYTAAMSPRVTLGLFMTSAAEAATSDSLSPRTALVVGAPSYSSATVIVSSATPLHLTAVDDELVIGDGLGRGDTVTFLSIGTAPFAVVSGSFSLVAEGTHTVRFYSVDLAGNVESVQTRPISVDLSAPVSLLQFVGVGNTDARGMLVISTDTLLGFTANDPNSSGVAAGVKQISVGVDGGALAVYQAPFALSPGFHAISYFAMDNLNNTETPRTVQISVGTPPLTSVEFVAKSTIGADAQTVAVDSSNNVYVSAGTRILKLNPEGQLLTSWGSSGSGPGQLGTADGMRIGPDGNLYVSDSVNRVVHVFEPSGAFLTDISGGFTALAQGPLDVAFDSKGQLNVLDIRAGQIFRMQLDGSPIATIPVVPGSFGGLAIDPQDNMYVANFTARRVQKYTAAGQQLLSFGGEAGSAALNRPRDLDIDPAGRVHVADWFGNRIAVYGSTGTFIGEYGTYNTNPDGVLQLPTGIAILKSGARVWISPPGPGQAVLQYALQTMLPSAPVIVSPMGNIRVYGAAPLIVGRAKAGMKVTLFDAGLLAATTAVWDSSGLFAIQIPLSVGPHRITAQTISNMGFSSPLSGAADFTLAAAPPAFNFASPVLSRIPNPPSEGITAATTVIADFDGDGNPDLFAIGGSGYAVFLGDGKGNFRKPPPVYFPGSGNFSGTVRAYAADLNKDGKMDVVILDRAPLLRVMSGNGNGTFGDGTYQSVTYISQGFPAGYAPLDFFLADLNNDANLDIITTDGRSLGVLLGQGDPGFTFAPQPLVPTGGSPFLSPHALQTADLNRDGKLDVVTEGGVFFGDGRGGFSSSTVLCAQCRFPLIGDFNQDGNPDIALNASNGANVFVGFGDGTFKALPPQPSGGLMGTLGVTGPVLDLNGDGLQDLVYGDFSGNVTLHPGRGDGLFGAAQTISLGSSCSYIETISAADFNKDGAVDLASALNFNPCTVDEVSVLFNRAVPPDGVPPAAVADLAAQSNRDGTVRLTWISPGDNGVIGQAAVYDLRVATAPMTTPALFNSAASLSGVSTPLVAGSSESFIVAGLPGGTTFYFALRTTDRAGNTSALSNGPAVKTPFVTRSIASINGQPEFGFVNATLQPSLTVIASTSAVGTLVLGSATAQGLAFVSRIYELQPEGATFAPPATMTMRYSTAALAGLGLLEQDLALYRFAAVQGWIRIPDQTLDTQNKLITVPIGAIMSIYALGGIVRDLTPPLTILITVTDSRFIDSTGGLYGSSSTAFGFAAFDPIAFGTASGVAFTQFRIDAATPTAPFSLFTTSYALAEGRHLLEFRSQDAAGNLEITRSSQVFVDGTAPRTSLVLNGPRAPGSSSSTFVVSSGTSLGFQSIDPLVNGAASGAAKVNFRVDGGTFAVFSATFTLTPGEHSVEFDAVDNVGNVEAVQRAMIFVDTQTPNVILISPKGGERFLAGVSTIAVQFVVTHPLDPAATFYATFVEQQDRGSPRGNRPAVVVVSSGQVLLPLDLDDGLWQLRIAAADYVLNATVVLSAPFEIVHDTMPPRISLAISTPQAPGGPGGAPFVIGRTLLTLSSIDDLVGSNDALGLGTAFQEVSVNGLLRMRFQNSNPAQGQVFSSSFTLNADSDGVHILTFIARDVLQNQTVVHRTTVAVDNTPPATRLIVSTPSFGAFVSIRTALTLSAVDPLLNGVASGIAVTRYQDNGGTFTASTAPLALAEGAHMVAFQSADNLGNQEALRSTNVLVDATPPVATVAIGLPAFNSADGTIYITPATPVIFSAADPTLAGSTIAGSGLAHIEIAVDGAPFAAYVTTLTFTEGRHTVSYRAVDNVGNVEPARTLALLSDATPPASALGASGAYFAAAGRNFAPPSFVYALSAQDVVANGVASGLSATMFRVDGSSFSRYVSTFSLTEGVRRVDFQSADTVDNLELLKSATVFVDATAPITALAVLDGRQFPGPNAASFYASSDTRFSLPAADPVAGGVASGLAHTRYQDNAGVFQIFASPFGLLEGAHLLAYQSQDNVLNMEVLRSTTVLVDATAPVSSATIGSPVFIGADGTRYITPVTPVTLSAFDPVVNAVASGVDRIEISIDGGAFGAYASTLIFAEGRHTILYRAVDRVGNVETTRRLELQSDNTPPATAFTPSGALFSAGGRSYAPAQFTYALPAQDPVVSNVASGVAFTNYRTGQAAYQNFVSAFSLSEGIRRVEFQSQDNIGNLELLKSATVFVDATVPVSALAVGNPKFDPGSGQPVFVTAATLLTLSAQDPVVQEVASGVRQISLRRGADAFAPYVASFTLTLPDGLKTVDYFSTDNVGNVEVARSTSFALDNTAPATALAVLGGRQFAGPSATSFYASSDTRLALPAVDPTVNGVASGLALTQWQDNGGALSPFASSFGLPEGVHTLGYQSQDRVQNLEVLRSTTVLIDATPPVTAAQLGAPLFTAVGGIHYIAPATPVTFTASDPAVSGVASGVNRIEVAVDGGAFAAYTSALTFAEGRHTILYRAVDNVANLETVQTLQVQSDATPPAASLAIGAPKFDPGAGQPVFVAATTRLTLSAQDPVVQNVASGVRQISFRRGGDAFGAYAAPFGLALPDGLKTLDYFATDNVGNQEITRSTAVALDASAPVTSLAVLGGRQFPGPNAGSFYASSDTRLALPAVDPAVGGVASGLALTQWQDNSSTFQNFASPFGLAEGSHLLAYQSQDRVLNLEVPRSTTVLVDATPPVSSALIGAPAFTASDGTIYITPSTPLTLSAVDPALPTGQPGSAVSRIEVAIDGGPFAVYSAALTFAEGRHTILYRAIDNVANVEVIHTLQLRSDATPPVSSLVVGQPRFQLPSVLLVSTRTPFSIAPVDPIVNNVASGLKDTSFRVSGASPFAAFTAPFTMTGGDANKVIEFFSRDNVLNTEVVKSSTVLLDSTPPEVALLSPASCGAGICRVLKGKFPVLGTARDTHFADYRLEFAPGKDASAGFALISSGTLAMSSGTLATWDATALSGWSTVRLSAVDLVANTASVAFTVFVGDPGQLMLLGNHEIFDMPEGVAVGGDGKIYVADRNNDRIVVFSSTGALLVSLGGHKDDDQGKHKASTTTVRLNKPSGVAVDASGNIYVADTNRDRVLKLSAAGEVVLTLGLREHEDDDDKHTRLPGQFQHPAGVAVDSLSNIYVADTGNHRVQVFNSAGVFSFQFDMPPVPDRLDHDDDEKDDDDDGERAELGKPSGIAVDAAGHIYVADSKGGRALKFGATGQLLLTIPIMSDKPGRQGQPFGVAVSAEGDCLLVSDRKTSRILKFDFLGNSNLVFASKGKIDDDDAPAPSATIVLKKPMGLALDAHGNLFVADRNNDRIQKFGLPTGAAPLVVPTPKDEDDHIARGVVDTEDGGKIERRDRAAVDIPAGAVALDLKVTVSTPAFSIVDDSNRRRAAEDANLKTASPPVEYGPHGTQFRKSVTLTLPYSPDLLALQKIDAKDLQVRYWNRDKSKWEDLESVVDLKTRTVKAKTTHFSLYQVFSGTVSAAAFAPLAADAAFTFRDAYAFPNPVRGSGSVTIRIQTGLADSVEVRVYDVSGRKIHSSSNFSLNPNFDDGNGKGAQYTYDHVWDVSGVGSGVYQYVISAKKSGQSDVHKTGRVGIIK